MKVDFGLQSAQSIYLYFIVVMITITVVNIKLKLFCLQPADARVIVCNNLTVDESSLTGETEPREKLSDPLPDLTDDCDVSSIANIVFMGTLVCSGILFQVSVSFF